MFKAEDKSPFKIDILFFVTKLIHPLGYINTPVGTSLFIQPIYSLFYRFQNSCHEKEE